MNTGLKIKQLRIKKGLTQSQLQEITGIDAASIRKYENGQYKAKLSTLKVIANALDVDVEALVMSDMTVTKAMHALFFMYQYYGGELTTYEFDNVDIEGKPFKQERVGVSFELLNPIMILWSKIIKAYEESDYEGKEDDLQWVMDNFPYSFVELENETDIDKIKSILNKYDEYLDGTIKINLDEDYSENKKKEKLKEFVTRIMKEYKE